MKIQLFLGMAASALALFTPAAPPGAQGREVLSDEEMADARGGVLVAGNVAFEFGAVVKTFEDGVLSLQTQVNWTPQGANVQQTAGPNVAQLGQNLANQINAQVQAGVQAEVQSALQAANPANGQTTPAGTPAGPTTLATTTGQGAPTTTPAIQSTVAAVLGGAQSAVQTAQALAQGAQNAASGQGGNPSVAQTTPAVEPTIQSTVQSTVQAANQVAGPVTVQPTAASPGQTNTSNTQSVFVTSSGANIIQQVAQGQLLNILMNTANNHAFVQNTDITLILPGFLGIQAGMAQQINGMRIADEIRSAINAGRH
ncbi:MAG: hypothetical protein JWQ97_2459 [Phenylobacterium sp.]|nr:hypothetical protein [Phenylobacterium sp.]